MPVYLDCNATTPIEPEVLDVIVKYMRDDYGNAGSRTHEFGLRAQRAVELARHQVASVVGASPEEVVFTSGATESNNLAIQGIVGSTERRHIVSSRIEHPATLEPLRRMAQLGFDVTLVAPLANGQLDIQALAAAMRPDTALVSVMHVNNETGVIQPIEQIATLIEGAPCLFHVDAAQGFGKDLNALKSKRIDFISVSAHKIFGPKGIGALIVRKLNGNPSIQPILLGGGQERGLRAGTLPVALIAGFGRAASLAVRDHAVRRAQCERIRREALDVMTELDAEINGAPELSLPHTLNLSLPGLDGEAAMVVLKDVIAISNGAACSSASYRQSHVLHAMDLSPDRIARAVRLSWSHLTPEIPWGEIASRIRAASH
jgi:cysteine desulfurase